MKSSTRKLGTAIVGLAVVVFVASVALAGPGGFGRGMMGNGPGGCQGIGPGYGQGMGRGQGCLPFAGSLTAEQAKELQTLREGHLKDIAPLQNQLFAKKTELRTLWAEANPDKDAIMAKQAEINELKLQLQEKNTKFQFDMRSIAGK